MRLATKMLGLLAVLSLMTGCTSAQVKDASGHMALGLLGMAFDIATDGPERRAEERRRREAVPGYERNRCLRACEWAQELAEERSKHELKERKRRFEAEKFRAEFDQFMQALETAEKPSGKSPPIVITTQE